MGPGSVIVMAEGVPTPKIQPDRTVYTIPFGKLVEPLVADAKLRKLVINMIYVGVVSFLLGIDPNEVDRALVGQLGRKPKALEMNRAAIRAGLDYAAQHLKKAPFQVRRLDKNAGKILIDGNHAAALGAMFGGVTYVSWYPITPSSSLAEQLESLLARHRRDPQSGKATYRRGPGRGRDRGDRDGAGRRLGRRARHDHHVGTRPLADDRVHGIRATTPRFPR